MVIELDDPLRESLDVLRRSFDLERARVCWIPSPNIHLTLAFLGGQPEECISGLADEADESGCLQGDLVQALSALGIVLESHDFASHLTLGRVKEAGPRGALTSAVASAKNSRLGTLIVDRFVLFRSELST